MSLASSSAGRPALGSPMNASTRWGARKTCCNVPFKKLVGMEVCAPVALPQPTLHLWDANRKG
eukprot:1160276-Pelagomonas_calceolata.AAC.6